MPTVSEDSQSSLVLFVASELSDSKALLVKDANGKILDKFEWLKGLPAYREFILPPKNYSLLFPGPIKSIDVGTSSGVKTFVQYAFTTENGAQAVEITSWRGEPNATITKAISELTNFKVDLQAVRLELGPEGTEIRFSTDPPYPNPFDPPPREREPEPKK